MLALAVLLAAALWAGAQNALAGGGSFVTLPALMLSGMDARTANITSTIALFPGQVATGFAGRSMVSGAQGLSFRTLTVISLAGGVVGAFLLLATPSSFFERLLPWLVLFATGSFAWGTFGPKPSAEGRQLGPVKVGLIQFGIAVYGGYFGGGIGFLMLAALTIARLPVRAAGATKNVLAAVMNASAVLIFLFSGQVRWLQAGVACVGAVIGGQVGAWTLKRADERALRVVVICIGCLLTIGLFVRAYRQ